MGRTSPLCSEIIRKMLNSGTSWGQKWFRFIWKWHLHFRIFKSKMTHRVSKNIINWTLERNSFDTQEFIYICKICDIFKTRSTEIKLGIQLWIKCKMNQPQDSSDCTLSKHEQWLSSWPSSWRAQQSYGCPRGSSGQTWRKRFRSSSHFINVRKITQEFGHFC